MGSLRNLRRFFAGKSDRNAPSCCVVVLSRCRGAVGACGRRRPLVTYLIVVTADVVAAQCELAGMILLLRYSGLGICASTLERSRLEGRNCSSTLRRQGRPGSWPPAHVVVSRLTYSVGVAERGAF